MRVAEARDLAVRAQPARHDEADVTLLDEIGGAITDARLRARVRDRREPQCVLVEVGCLLRVPDQSSMWSQPSMGMKSSCATR